MLPLALLNQLVSIKRRVSQGRDSLNNPEYGPPTSGAGWNTIYNNMPVRMAFSTKQVRFAPEGERILPTGVMYYNPGYDLKAEDRVLTADGIEYNVISVQEGVAFGSNIYHWEAVLQLP